MSESVGNPYLLPSRSVVSFSGGRTSAYMLRMILDAFGDTLPEDRVVVFCNTGKENPETLDFVRQCGLNWGVRNRWLEYRREPGRNSFAEVDHATASRHGEPFQQLIASRDYLPNPVTRFCTAEMKIRTTNRFVRRTLGWHKYGNAIGLRADEPKRVAKMRKEQTVKTEWTLFGDVTSTDRGASHPTGETPLLPLADSGVRNADVLAFWRTQSFDLGLPIDPVSGRTLGGNCDLCFLKGTRTIIDSIKQKPGSADWWSEREAEARSAKPSGATFRKDRANYAAMKRIALGMAPHPLFTEADMEGMACGEEVECHCTD